MTGDSARRRELVGEELLLDAARYVIGTQNGALRPLQHRFEIGFIKAAAILQLLEESGVVGTSDGVRPREVLTPRGDPQLLESVLDSLRSGS